MSLYAVPLSVHRLHPLSPGPFLCSSEQIKTFQCKNILDKIQSFSPTSKFSGIKLTFCFYIEVFWTEIKRHQKYEVALHTISHCIGTTVPGRYPVHAFIYDTPVGNHETSWLSEFSGCGLIFELISIKSYSYVTGFSSYLRQNVVESLYFDGISRLEKQEIEGYDYSTGT
jgi:hypothetical protein